MASPPSSPPPPPPPPPPHSESASSRDPFGRAMPIVAKGDGPLFSAPDMDAQREATRRRSRGMTDKRMSVKQAVGKLIKSGDYLASGGFGTNRISVAVLHEILRQDIDGLGFAGHTTTHDFQIMAAGHRGGRKLLDRVDAAYIVGLEARGLSTQARRVMQSGDVKICEWSNYALALRFKAAAMGVPHLPCRSLLGTDTFRKSAAVAVDCPFSGTRLALIPALSPEVAIIHVHEADVTGNAWIDGITVADADLAKAAKRVILTTERIVDTDVFRDNPQRTTILGLYVDAVCQVPFGSYPGNMSGEYFSDESHLREWLTVEKTEAGIEHFIEQHILSQDDFDGYLESTGAVERLPQLQELERLNRGGDA